MPFLRSCWLLNPDPPDGRLPSTSQGDKQHMAAAATPPPLERALTPSLEKEGSFRAEASVIRRLKAVKKARDPLEKERTLPILTRHVTTERLGVEHLAPLADASSSLSLIATLVLAAAVTVLLDGKQGVALFEGECPQSGNGTMNGTADTIFCTFSLVGLMDTIQVILLCGAVGFSTYTLCFSLLEYYYSQLLIGVDASIVNSAVLRDEDEAAGGGGGGGNGGDDEGSFTGHATAIEVVRKRRRASLAQGADAVFESLTSRRKKARDAMWASLICLLGATASKVASFFVGVGWRPWHSWLLAAAACAPLVVGVRSVFETVLHFRRIYSAVIQGVNIGGDDSFFANQAGMRVTAESPEKVSAVSKTRWQRALAVAVRKNNGDGGGDISHHHGLTLPADGARSPVRVAPAPPP